MPASRVHRLFATLSPGTVAVTLPNVEDDDVKHENHSPAPPPATKAPIQPSSACPADDLPGHSNLKCDALAAFETETGNGIEPVCQQTPSPHLSCEVIKHDLEEMRPDSGMNKQDAGMIKQESETIAADAPAPHLAVQISKSRDNTTAENEAAASPSAKSECDPLAREDEAGAGNAQDDDAAPVPSQRQRRNVNMAVPSAQSALIASEVFSPGDYLAAFNIVRLSFHKSVSVYFPVDCFAIFCSFSYRCFRHILFICVRFCFLTLV